MATHSNNDAQEIQKIISDIKKTVNQTFRMDSSTIELINNHLGRLMDFLTSLDNAQDLMSAVIDFISSTNNLLGIFNNHLQIKLILKSQILKLEEAFLSFQQHTDCYRQLLFMPGLSFRHSEEN